MEKVSKVVNKRQKESIQAIVKMNLAAACVFEGHALSENDKNVVHGHGASAIFVVSPLYPQ